eukprot:1176126-Rhodomonas_salina.1
MEAKADISSWACAGSLTEEREAESGGVMGLGDRGAARVEEMDDVLPEDADGSPCEVPSEVPRIRAGAEFYGGSRGPGAGGGGRKRGEEGGTRREGEGEGGAGGSVVNMLKMRLE